jgi:hypothetical protein
MVNQKARLSTFICQSALETTPLEQQTSVSSLIAQAFTSTASTYTAETRACVSIAKCAALIVRSFASMTRAFVGIASTIASTAEAAALHARTSTSSDGLRLHKQDQQ